MEGAGFSLRALNYPLTGHVTDRPNSSIKPNLAISLEGQRDNVHSA